jgi:hypothetical protein
MIKTSLNKYEEPNPAAEFCDLGNEPSGCTNAENSGLFISFRNYMLSNEGNRHTAG